MRKREEGRGEEERGRKRREDATHPL